MWLFCGVFLGEGADGHFCCRICRGVGSGGRFLDVLLWVGGRSVVIPNGEVRDLIVYDSVTALVVSSGACKSLLLHGPAAPSEWITNVPSGR